MVSNISNDYNHCFKIETDTMLNIDKHFLVGILSSYLAQYKKILVYFESNEDINKFITRCKIKEYKLFPEENKIILEEIKDYVEEFIEMNIGHNFCISNLYRNFKIEGNESYIDIKFDYMQEDLFLRLNRILSKRFARFDNNDLLLRENTVVFYENRETNFLDIILENLYYFVGNNDLSLSINKSIKIKNSLVKIPNPNKTSFKLYCFRIIEIYGVINYLVEKIKKDQTLYFKIISSKNKFSLTYIKNKIIIYFCGNFLHSYLNTYPNYTKIVLEDGFDLNSIAELDKQFNLTKEPEELVKTKITNFEQLYLNLFNIIQKKNYIDSVNLFYDIPEYASQIFWDVFENCLKLKRTYYLICDGTVINMFKRNCTLLFNEGKNKLISLKFKKQEEFEIIQKYVYLNLKNRIYIFDENLNLIISSSNLVLFFYSSNEINVNDYNQLLIYMNSNLGVAKYHPLYKTEINLTKDNLYDFEVHLLNSLSDFIDPFLGINLYSNNYVVYKVLKIRKKEIKFSDFDEYNYKCSLYVEGYNIDTSSIRLLLGSIELIDCCFYNERINMVIRITNGKLIYEYDNKEFEKYLKYL